MSANPATVRRLLRLPVKVPDVEDGLSVSAWRRYRDDAEETAAAWREAWPNRDVTVKTNGAVMMFMDSHEKLLPCDCHCACCCDGDHYRTYVVPHRVRGFQIDAKWRKDSV